MTDSYRRISYNRNTAKNTNTDDITEDLKNDLLLAFNLYKSEDNKINKTKLRTILFSFAMYKSSPKQINDYISEFFPKQEEFTFDNLLVLIFYKLKNLKEIEADSLFSIIGGGKSHQNQINKSDISKALESNGIEISDKEINEMMCFIAGADKFHDDLQITKDEFKKFII